MKKLAASAVLILLALALALPYLIGLRAETLFYQEAANLSVQLGQPIVVEDYQRGWFNSHAKTRVVLTDTATMETAHRITHGPYRVFGWAAIESLPQIDGSPFAALLDDADITIDSKINFDGSVDMHAQSQAFQGTLPELPQTALSAAGIDAHAHIAGAHVDYQLNIPELVLEDANVRLQASQIEVGGQGSLATRPRGADGDYWSTSVHARIGKALIQGDNGHIQGTLAWTMEGGLDDANLYGVESRLRLADVAVVLEQDQKSQFHITNAELKLAVQGIAPQPLLKLIEHLQAVAERPDAAPGKSDEEALAQLVQYLPKLIADNTRLSIAIPNFDSSAGELGLQLQARLARPQVSAAAPQFVAQLLESLQVDLQAFADQSLLEQSADDMDPYLATLVGNNILTLEDQRYRLSARYASGELTLNGEPANELLQLLTVLLL
ncbi:MAG TPA: DUF945 family protein [Salinisphaeraceae bacterium]|nr:DUF945 family protein [Salinisphaeraceae bacterium]